MGDLKKKYSNLAAIADRFSFSCCSAASVSEDTINSIPEIDITTSPRGNVRAVQCSHTANLRLGHSRVIHFLPVHATFTVGPLAISFVSLLFILS